jgi:hypothetical protein
MKEKQDIDQVRAEYYRISAEAGKRYESKKQKFIQEIQNIPVSEPTDNPTRVETQTLFNDITDFVHSQFAIINEMGKKVKCLTMEMSLTHFALVAVLKEIRTAFEAKINEYDNCNAEENETTKASILKQYPNANIDWNNHRKINIMYEKSAKSKELLCNDWLGFIDWQIETVQSWLRLNMQNTYTMLDTIIRENNILLVEIKRLDAEFYKNTDKETLKEKFSPVIKLIKRDLIEKKQFGYDTEQGNLNLEHLQLLIEAGIETPAPLPQNEYRLTPDVEKVIKEQILPIWKGDVLENTPDDTFLNAIITADFTVYRNMNGKKQKVEHFIFALSKIMGYKWANDVISKLNDDKASLQNFQKRQPVTNLKNAMKGITVVNNASNQFKINTNTQYIDKTTNKPYYKATKH